MIIEHSMTMIEGAPFDILSRETDMVMSLVQSKNGVIVVNTIYTSWPDTPKGQLLREWEGVECL